LFRAGHDSASRVAVRVWQGGDFGEVFVGRGEGDQSVIGVIDDLQHDVVEEDLPECRVKQSFCA
jgi:hypothetical protein